MAPTQCRITHSTPTSCATEINRCPHSNPPHPLDTCIHQSCLTVVIPRGSLSLSTPVKLPVLHRLPSLRLDSLERISINTKRGDGRRGRPRQEEEGKVPKSISKARPLFQLGRSTQQNTTTTRIDPRPTNHIGAFSSPSKSATSRTISLSDSSGRTRSQETSQAWHDMTV